MIPEIIEHFDQGCASRSVRDMRQNIDNKELIVLVCSDCEHRFYVVSTKSRPEDLVMYLQFRPQSRPG